MKRHGMLLLLLAVFALPVVLAKLILEMGWYQGGVTNRGELLAAPVSPSWLAKDQKWQLVYLLPEQCDAACQGALFNLRQVPQAVGADMDRISAVVLMSDTAPPLELQGLAVQPISNLDAGQIATLEFGAGAIYLADPQGLVFMAYPLVSEQSEILAQGKDVLRDLKRLLKVSKVG